MEKNTRRNCYGCLVKSRKASMKRKHLNQVLKMYKLTTWGIKFSAPPNTHHVCVHYVPVTVAGFDVYNFDRDIDLIAKILNLIEKDTIYYIQCYKVWWAHTGGPPPQSGTGEEFQAERTGYVKMINHGRSQCAPALCMGKNVETGEWFKGQPENGYICLIKSSDF